MGNPRLQPGRGMKKLAEAAPPAAPPKKTAKPKGPTAGDRQWFGYCIKDKKKMEMLNPKKDQFKNGTKTISGKCPGCGAKLSVIVKQEVWDAFKG